MNAYRFNQIAMAVLGALLLFFGARTIINIAFEEHEEKPGYDVPGTEEKPGEQKPAGSDLAALLAKADAAHGAEVAKKCGLCHNFDKGGPNMIGPNLYGVLGRKVASHEGYDYSDALKAKGGNWDYESINKMITNPNEYVPGTKMAIFPGLPDAKDRADVLAFLRTKNDNPPPLPEVKPGETPAPGGEATTPAAPAGADFMAALATADPKAGEADVGLCKLCHTFNKGGTTLVGPNLYGVVGRKIASVEGFNYTPGLKAHEGDWTFDKLDAWLTNPAAFAPGTMMSFPGIPDTKKRADVIAYLNANSDSPLPIPKAGSGGAAEGEKGAAAPAASAAPAAAPEATPPAATPPAAEATPPAATPATPAPEAAAPAETPSAETPAAPAPEAAPPEAAPSAETPPATEGAPSAETPAAPAPEAAPPEAAPSAETPPAPAPEAAPPEAAPSAETPPAPAPEATEPAETPGAPAAETEPSTGDDYLSSQPQPVYPDGPPDAQ
ncbi:MAG TPA: cytochrome c family protein [Allosphingosinicella sp.]